MRGSGESVLQPVIDLFKTPFMIGVAVTGGLAVAMHGFVDLARDHKSGETICVDAGGDWDGVYKNCDMGTVKK